MLPPDSDPDSQSCKEMLKIMARNNALGLPSEHGGSNNDASMRLASALSIIACAQTADGVNMLLERFGRGDPSQRTWVDDSVPENFQHQLSVLLINACSNSDHEADAKVRLLSDTGVLDLGVWKRTPSLGWLLYAKAIQRGESGDTALVRKLVAADLSWSFESLAHDPNAYVRHQKKRSRPSPFTPLACACELLQKPTIHIDIFELLFIRSKGQIRDPVLGDGGTLLHWVSECAAPP
jgi:hypothetical protein